jgi:DNA-directed RNA polymerase subunit RPC12/RpoP
VKTDACQEKSVLEFSYPLLRGASSVVGEAAPGLRAWRFFLSRRKFIITIEVVTMKCATCGGTAEAERGSKILCQTCVTEFLARNVGLMEEEKDVEADEQKEAPVD